MDELLRKLNVAMESGEVTEALELSVQLAARLSMAACRYDHVSAEPYLDSLFDQHWRNLEGSLASGVVNQLGGE